MKINKEKFPILIKDESRIDYTFVDSDEEEEMCKYLINSAFADRSTKYLYPSSVFMKSAMQHRDKLVKLIPEMKPGNYFILTEDYGILSVHKKDDDFGVVKFIEYDRGGDDVFNYCNVIPSGYACEIEKYDEKIWSDAPEDSWTLNFKHEGNVMGSVFNIEALIALLFYQFADVETLVLNNLKKKGHLANCKYLNESDTEIEIVNSTWFTNLINSEGFKVRGHFAIRAYGEGRTQRRLVWITEYKKSGYERKAGILKQNTNHP